MFLVSRYQIERRNLVIDFLRGCAVFLVLCMHFTYTAIPSGLRVRWPLSFEKFVSLLGNGFYFMSVFFVISGFVITTKLLERSNNSLRKIDLGHFYLFRFSRIFPGLFLFCVIFSALYLLRQPEYYLDYISLKDLLYAIFTFQCNVYALHHLPVGLGRWGVLWSLGIEEVFYLGFPLLCLAIRSHRGIIFALLLLIVVGPICRMKGGVDSIHLNLSCFDQMAFGCIGAMIAGLERFRKLRSCYHYALCIVGFVLILATWNFATLQEYYVLGPSFAALGATMYLCGQGPFKKIQTFSELRMMKKCGVMLLLPLSLLGLLSYELYLFHLLFLSVAESVLKLYQHRLNWEFSFTLGYLLFVLIAALLAAGIYFYILEPVRNWVRSFITNALTVRTLVRADIEEVKG